MENEEKDIENNELESIEEVSNKQDEVFAKFQDEIEQIDEIEGEKSISFEPEEKEETLEEKLQSQDEFSFLDEEKNMDEMQVIEEEKPAIEEVSQQVTLADDFEEEESTAEELITVRPVKFQQFENVSPNRTIKKNLDIMQDVSMHISVELGRTKSTIREVMSLVEGSVVELDKIAGEQVEVFVNEKLVAKGEVIVIEDKFGVRITSTNIQKQV